jgi:hypothetical protein
MPQPIFGPGTSLTQIRLIALVLTCFIICKRIWFWFRISFFVHEPLITLCFSYLYWYTELTSTVICIFCLLPLTSKQQTEVLKLKSFLLYLIILCVYREGSSQSIDIWSCFLYTPILWCFFFFSNYIFNIWWWSSALLHHIIFWLYAIVMGDHTASIFRAEVNSVRKWMVKKN